MEKVWYLYILQCGDGTFYTGITTDIPHRLDAHRNGRGAKYTRGRGPLSLFYYETCGTHSDALRRELEVKALSHQEKNRLPSVNGSDEFHDIASKELNRGE